MKTFFTVVAAIVVVLAIFGYLRRERVEDRVENADERIEERVDTRQDARQN